MDRIAVLGAGSWGTTLANLLAHKGYDVALWIYEPELCDAINNKRENTLYLPGTALSENITAYNSISMSLKGSGIIVSVIPSHALRAVMQEAAAHINDGSLVISATKGIEQSTLLTPSNILAETLSGAPVRPTVVLSGPSFAKEVSLRLPTAVCASSLDAEAASDAQRIFSTPFFRVYTNSDVIGAELGGALKNVMAIASGISDGLSLGANARAALITRGLAEITRLGVALGAKASTFSGLTGLGDLVLTCTDALSRNYTTGLHIGMGMSPNDAVGATRMVSEGVKTSRAARDLARKSGIQMPITEAVCAILHEGKPPKDAVLELMMRDLKQE